jgi:hypothetical protein
MDGTRRELMTIGCLKVHYIVDAEDKETNPRKRFIEHASGNVLREVQRRKKKRREISGCGC